MPLATVTLVGIIPSFMAAGLASALTLARARISNAMILMTNTGALIAILCLLSKTGDVNVDLNGSFVLSTSVLMELRDCLSRELFLFPP